MPFDGVLPKVCFGGSGTSASVAACEIFKLADKNNRIPPDIHFFEAHSHLGGRTKSYIFKSPFGEIVLDEQARWFHRGWENRFALFLLNNFKELGHRFGIPDMKGDFFHDKVDKRFFLTEKNLLRTSFRAAAFEILEDTYGKYIDGHAADIPLDALGALTRNQAVIDEVELLCTWTGAAPQNVSSKEIMEDPSNSGGLVFKGGIARLITMMNAYLRSRGVQFHTNTRINAISRFSDYCVLTDQNGIEYSGDMGVVTFSAGVMKEAIKNETIKFWPEPAPQLIEYLGQLIMANMTKVTVASDDINLPGRVDFKLNKFPGFIDALPGFAPTVIFGGSGAIEVENMDDDRRTELIGQLLRNVGQFPIDGLTPDFIHCTKAHGNAFTRGSYSILRPNGQRREFIEDGAVLYGGEAYVQSSRSPGTLEGAHDSGVDLGKAIYAKLERRLPLKGQARNALSEAVYL